MKLLALRLIECMPRRDAAQCAPTPPRSLCAQLAALCAALSVCTPSPSFAVDTPATDAPPPSFHVLDRNRDQQISRTEASWDRRLAKQFAYVDTNGNGFIDAEEFAAQSRS